MNFMDNKKQLILFYLFITLFPNSRQGCSEHCITCTSNNHCDKCEDRYFVNKQFSCSLCGIICKTCEDSTGYCSSCIKGFFFHLLIIVFNVQMDVENVQMKIHANLVVMVMNQLARNVKDVFQKCVTHIVVAHVINVMMVII